MRLLKKMLTVLLTIVLLSSGSVTNVAAEYEAVGVELPYRHVYTTTDSAADSQFHYIIESTEGGGALPTEANESGTFALQGKSGEGTSSGETTVYIHAGTLHFSFSKPGVYVYRIRADVDTDGTRTNAEKYTLEARVYTVSFFIANGAEAGSLKLSMMTISEGGRKVETLELAPSYQGTPPPQPTQTPSPTPAATPTPAGRDPETGDSNQLGLYLGLMAGGAAALLVLGWIAFRKRKDAR